MRLFVIVLILFTVLASDYTVIAQSADYSTDYHELAAELMQECLGAIKDLRAKLGYPIDYELDPNETGIIGEEFTPLTTSIIGVEDKRTTANPAFASLITRFFTEAGLNKGDVVAIGASGSYPSLVIASMCAAHSLGLEPIVIVSLGSSTYGANLPNLSMADMLVHLNRVGLLPYSLAGVSLGGGNDQGHGVLFDDDPSSLIAAALRTPAPLIWESSLSASIRRRIVLYNEQADGAEIACFVNVGAAGANLGYTTASMRFPNGLVTEAAEVPLEDDAGLIFYFIARGVPVVNLLNIKQLCRDNNLPFDPKPLPLFDGVNSLR